MIPTNLIRRAVISSRRNRLVSSATSHRHHVHVHYASKASKPTISNLLHSFDRLPNEPLPDPLAATFREFASREAKEAQNGEYERMKVEMSGFINNFFRLQMGGRTTSEAVYSPQTLDIYDAYVWRFNSPFLWRISEEECQEMYEQNIGKVHCEVAVGTGLFLKNLSAGKKPKRLALVDLNENSIFSCGERVNEAVQVEGDNLSINIDKLVADITKIESIPDHMKGKYQSVGANFLLHCLHGDSLLDKKVAVEGCASLLSSSDDASFFGSTILGKDILDDGDKAGAAALKTLEDYNEWGVFGNKNDTYEDLETILNDVFQEVDVRKSGYCGVWKASKPR